MHKEHLISELKKEWETNPRWKGIKRPYSAEEVLKLRGSIKIEHTLADMGSRRFWELIQTEPFVKALGSVTGNQAVQMVQAGLKAVYCSGWQVAGDANTAGQTYPDQSLYPADSVPALVRRINNALIRADQIAHLEGRDDTYWFAPIVADAEAGFGGNLNAYELVKALIEAGAAAIHFEDQVSSLKKCGHMGGKVLVPASEFTTKLAAARLSADVAGVPTVLIGRTDADGANLITSDIDPIDADFIKNSTRTVEGFYNIKGGLELAVARARAFAPYSDIVWCETSKPDIGEAREFAEGVREKFPNKPLAYNCSPSFNWKKNLSEKEIATFQETLAEMGYKFQFITLAGFHSLNTGMFELSSEYLKNGMAAYSRLQEREFELEREKGYSAVKHQAFVGAGYFDEIQLTVTSGLASTTALKGSTEEAQFKK